jgi:tetratricopeptide (TPR) repeat protein
MKSKIAILVLFVALFVTSCNTSVEYTPDFITQTSGRYLYNHDELIEVYYENNKLLLKWKGAERIEPVALGMNEIFIPDMYKKLHFVEHPETKARYLSILSEEEPSKITYDYLKVDDSFKTPSMHLKDKEYDKALEGYLKIKQEDPDSEYIREWDFNRAGYKHLRKEQYEDAIALFKLNAALHPDSDNVYDSLADAYAKSGDSLQAFENYSIALEKNSGNKRAKSFIEAYEGKNN